MVFVHLAHQEPRMANLLADPLIRATTGAQADSRLSLPEVFAALLQDHVEAFPALRPHQRHAWHAFLVQLGAIALLEAALTEPPRSADAWQCILRALTADHHSDEPWHLVVDDITRPAFMQPPARSQADRAAYKATVSTPDQLDMLVTSKNHDLKSAVASQADVDDWIFALICLQTMEGFSGAGNYGISRMNGGLGCRPAFSLTPSVRPGAHVRRDITVLLEKRRSIEQEYALTENGVSLLWALPWSGAKAESLTFGDLHPFYIEVCRRIRLRCGNPLTAVRATSRAPRIAAKALNGRTGDPWTPVSAKDSKSLTLATGGFTYKRTAEYLLSADWKPPPLLEPTLSERSSREPMWLVARAMVRGQGRTEGYHERHVPLRPEAQRVIGQAGGSELGDIARERIEDVRRTQRILRHAVWTFAAGGKTDSVSDETRAQANPWANRLDDAVNAGFFDGLQEEFEADSQANRRHIRRDWQCGVIRVARDLLRQAQAALPCPAIHRYRARVRADSVFEGRIRGNTGFPDLFDRQGGTEG